MGEWKECTLGDIINLKRGYDLSKSKRIHGEIPIISSSGHTGNHNEAKVNESGVITGRYGTIGKVFFINEPYWPLNTTLYVQDFKGNDKKFIYYFLKCLNFGKYSDKSTVPGINRNHVHLEKTKIPILNEQKAISNIFTSLDEKIDLLHRQNETLEEMAEVLFREWFVEQVEKGWKEGTLGELAKVDTGFAFKGKEYEFEGSLKVVRGKNVTLGNLRWGTDAKYWNHSTEGLEKYFLSKRDIVLGMDGSRVGRNRALVRESDLPSILAQRVARVRAIQKDAQPFIWTILYSDDFKNYVEATHTGTSIPHISQSQITDYEIVIPPMDLILKFSNLVSSFWDKMEKNSNEIQTLENLRDTLLPKLMSGEVRVQY